MLLAHKSAKRIQGLPAVVRERLVRLGLLVHILATLYGVAGVVGSVQNLACQTIRHIALAALAGKHDQPAQSQRLTALRANLERNLIGRAANAASLDIPETA